MPYTVKSLPDSYRPQVLPTDSYQPHMGTKATPRGAPNTGRYEGNELKPFTLRAGAMDAFSVPSGSTLK